MKQAPEQDRSRNQLLSIQQFRHASPINLRWAIQQHYSEMVEAGALLKYGRKILIDPQAFWKWLRDHGQRKANLLS